MNKIFPFILAFVLIATASHAQAQTTTSTSWKGVPYRVSRAMLKGDANGDGLINMSDVTLVINYILGRNIDDFSFDNAEVTGDGFINMSDVTAIIDIILGRNVDKKPQAYLTCPDDNHPHIIDLGLPSGTKWACCDVGATAPERHGGLFAWGAIEETGEPYQSSEEGEDGVGESICGTEHDVAHVKWGGAWQMPTVEQIRELCDYSTVSFDNVWNENGEKEKDLAVFTCPNGGKIIFSFIPEGEIEPIPESILNNHYWSGTACSSDEVSEYWDDVDKGAWGLGFFIDVPITPIGGYFEFSLFDVYPFTLDELACVRPIYNGESYGILFLSTNAVNIGVGDSFEVKILSGTGNYRFINTNSNIAEVTLSGSTITIKGKSEGTTTVTVTDNSSGMSLDISVKVQNICPDSNHPHMIDLGLPSGTKWACCNVGADKPEAKGNKYEWGETGESTDSLSYDDYSESIYEDIGEDGDISGTKYDVAHVKWGDSWCMPSCYLANELISHCTYEVITRNGEKGMAITGPTGKTIFLPYDDFIFRVPDLYAYRKNCGVYWVSGDGGSNYLLCSSEGEPVCDCDVLDIPGPSYVRPIIEGYNLSLSKSEMDLYYGESDKVAIYAGGGDYTISCSDTTIVKVSLKGSEIILFGKAPGTATVTVTDVSSGMTADIAVTVRFINRNKVSMYYGETTTVDVSGHGNYTVSNTSPSVIDVSLSGSRITIKAKATGKAIVTVTDTSTGTTADIIVTVSYRNLLLNANEVSILSGETSEVTITSGNGTYSASCSAPSIVEVTVDGSTVSLYGKESGTTNVTVYDDISGQTTKITVTVSAIILCPDDNHPHLIDLGLPSGTNWACCNVGATSPEGTGGYYAWGETEEKDDYSWDTYIHSDRTSDTYHDLGESISGTEYDVAYMKWGDAYQMPSSAQIEELLSNCKFKELTYEGVKGKLAISSNGNKLFIPFAGMRKDKSFSGLGDNGKYFSGSRKNSDFAYMLLVDKKYTFSNYVYRSYGLTVRPVSK